VGAVPDLLDERCGLIAPPGDAVALSGRIQAALDRSWNRQSIRNRVEGASWRENARRLHEILLAVTKKAGIA